MTDHPETEAQQSLALLQDSYKEVLDATKHQDDKIGRFLTAVSFLIGGSIALGTRTDIVQATYQLEPAPSDPVNLPAYLLALFLLFIVASLVLEVTGLGARLYRPGERPGTTESHMFFFSIAEWYERDPEAWERLWRPDAASIRESLVPEYKREIVNIARRARLKYLRTLYAGALLQLAILFLVLAAALGFLADSFPRLSDSPDAAVDWNALPPRLVVAVAVGVFALILALDFLKFERFDEAQRQVRFLLPLLCPAYAIVTVLHPGAQVNWWNTFGFFCVAVVVQVFVVAAGLAVSWRLWNRAWHRAVAILAGVLLVIGPATFLAFNRLQLGYLLAAILVVPLLLGLRLFVKPFPSHQEPAEGARRPLTGSSDRSET